MTILFRLLSCLKMGNIVQCNSPGIIKFEPQIVKKYQNAVTHEYSVTLGFFRNYPYQLCDAYIRFAASSSLLQRPYMVRFIIFSLLFVPSTNPLDNGLATAFSTAGKSFSRPEAKRESSFKVRKEPTMRLRNTASIKGKR